jgi:hypothetical protein
LLQFGVELRGHLVPDALQVLDGGGEQHKARFVFDFERIAHETQSEQRRAAIVCKQAPASDHHNLHPADQGIKASGKQPTARHPAGKETESDALLAPVPANLSTSLLAKQEGHPLERQ